MKRLLGIYFMLTACLSLPARGPVNLQNIRYYSYPEYTRVVLDLSADIKIAEKTLKGSSSGRLFFDLKNCRFAADYPFEKKNEIKIQAGNLQRIRIGKWNAQTIRVVFDFDKIGKYNRFYLTSPFRIVFDIYSQAEFVSHAQQAREQNLPVVEGSPSIARQLGLGVHRIVIDPGHGGKDPGTINRRLDLQEKNITLDIGKRLNAILNEHAEFEIILTRCRDEYVPLEERAAIANFNQGDIFVSIHTNSAPRQTARGVESYYLNITADPRAMEVAAQENAMSSKSMADMRTILNQILQNSKISESRILAQSIQRGMVANLKQKYDAVDDLGVKKAPFYVLLGAQMPSALIEVSFLSNLNEAKRLASPSYRQAVAAGLYLGIINFIQSLGK
ncbi:MAG: N-acetylmuramoyl-L-alanine amidase [Acidobacteria bacterium]|nr:N-acetylmuramoyl-L-alanine amidase [Acidobacteriota bacterium]MBU4306488.1 N-acetylmuramoyl-L-alanine amidase [Acidobacteriota bacterium]MBU4404323.1 N-acetylmuramoyl-L-alanine amidase [Acidobacteriota bacterium]MCG2812427.1 N-acetylmuramoyl-L-alanine amidase [Candidatus Aminicenantes bacterium]